MVTAGIGAEEAASATGMSGQYTGYGEQLRERVSFRTAEGWERKLAGSHCMKADMASAF